MDRMYTERVSCSKIEKNRMNKMRELFLKDHPEMKGMHLSEGFMVKQLMDYYEK